MKQKLVKLSIALLLLCSCCTAEAHAQYMMPIDGELYYLMDNGEILKHKK